MSASSTDPDRSSGRDELADLLAAGERAAFHGRPEAGVEPLRRAVEAADGAGRAAEATAATWLLGVCLGAAGRYGRALDVLGPLVTATDTPERRVFAALAAATVASVHRQLGRHAVAQGYDEAALAAAGGQSPEGRFDALLGLAADAVGAGDAAVARTRLAEAAAMAEGRADWWRQRVRLGWVRAEVALLTGAPADATAAATAAVELAERSDAPRHVAKGLLFLGVAQVEAGAEQAAVTTLRRAALLAESLGARPLQWPVRAVLGALLAERDPADAARCLRSAAGAVQAIAADLPPDLAAEWLARPDLAALRGAVGDGGGEESP